MNSQLLQLAASLILVHTVHAGPIEPDRLIEEQERQIRQLETENARLRWLLQNHCTEMVTDPLYGISGPGQEMLKREPLHTVVNGESLSQIARTYGSSVEALAALNQIEDPELIRVGDRLIIPPSSSNDPTPETPTEAIHLVKSGENLYRIAMQHGIALSELLAMNPDADPHQLRIGQRIRIHGHPLDGPALAGGSRTP